MKRELIVTAGGTDRTVVVEAGADGRFRVMIDGVAHDVDAAVIRAGTWSIITGGRSFVVDLDRRRSGIAASIGANDVRSTRPRASKSGVSPSKSQLMRVRPCWA